MDLTPYMAREGEKPLDNIVTDGGFFKIFRTVGCIGDSLSSGEFESSDEHGNPGYHDFYDYSWGQFMAREAGNTVYNFSRGGMTAKEYVEGFADRKGFWDEDKACQAYILALGVNDIMHQNHELGTIADIELAAMGQNKPTFAGYYGKIIQHLKSFTPHSKFFLMTMARKGDAEGDAKREAHAKLLHEMADLFDNTYVLDFYRYAPVYDETFRKNFYLSGHMNPQGYILTAKMTMSYIDYIVRNHPEDFAQVPFIGTTYYYRGAKR